TNAMNSVTTWCLILPPVYRKAGFMDGLIHTSDKLKIPVWQENGPTWLKWPQCRMCHLHPTLHHWGLHFMIRKFFLRNTAMGLLSDSMVPGTAQNFQDTG